MLQKNSSCSIIWKHKSFFMQFEIDSRVGGVVILPFYFLLKITTCTCGQFCFHFFFEFFCQSHNIHQFSTKDIYSFFATYGLTDWFYSWNVLYLASHFRTPISLLNSKCSLIPFFSFFSIQWRRKTSNQQLKIPFQK